MTENRTQPGRRDGGNGFFLSGEVHYFRLAPRCWERHLDALVECGCTGVSTYIPWSWHQPERDRRPDFTGRTHPARNVRLFLRLAAERGLAVLIKPGPYVMAELVGEGIPQWLSRGRRSELARDGEGRPWGACYFSYASDYFRRAAERWLTAVAHRVVLPLQAQYPGAIAGIQLCNEIGIFSWLRAEGDYSLPVRRAWQAFLQQRFPSLHELEKLLQKPLTGFEAVSPPAGPCRDRATYILYVLWHAFFRELYADYARFLAGCWHRAGVRGIPLIANVGGWVQGRGYDVLLNATFHVGTVRRIPGLVLGIDQIPEAVSLNNQPDGAAATQAVAALQSGSAPLFSAEMQCGSRQHDIVTYASELGLFYRQAVVNGLDGMNFYMFSQGRNPRGRGGDGRTFYWYTALDHTGRKMPMFKTCATLGAWLDYNGPLLAKARKVTDFAVVFHPAHHQVEFFQPRLVRRGGLDAEAVGVTDLDLFRDGFLFDTVLRIATQAGFLWSFTCLESGRRDLPERGVVVLAGYDTMDADSQEQLLSFVRRGGTLLILGWIPSRDPLLRPCTVLADGLGVRPADGGRPDRIRTGGVGDVPVTLSRPLQVRGRHRVTAVGRGGRVLGVEKRCGQGRVRVLSCLFRYTSEDHLRLVEGELDAAVRGQRWIRSEGGLMTDLRWGADGGFLLVGNPHREAIQGKIRVRIPDQGRRPLRLDRVDMAPLTGAIWPLMQRLDGETVLRYATAELRRARVTRDRLVLVLAPSAPNPLVVCLETPRRITRASVEGAAVSIRHRGETWTLTSPPTVRETTWDIAMHSSGSRGKSR